MPEILSRFMREHLYGEQNERDNYDSIPTYERKAPLKSEDVEGGAFSVIQTTYFGRFGKLDDVCEDRFWYQIHEGDNERYAG